MTVQDAEVEIVRYVAVVRRANGGSSRIVGKAPRHAIDTTPALIEHLRAVVPWLSFSEDDQVTLRILREGESARDLGLI